jgi:NADPH-dependent glutamate synthase beta subunit-like oxidoreductase
VDARPKKRLTDLVQSLAEPSPSGVDAARVVGLRFLLLPKAILPDPKRPGHVGSILMQRARLEGPAGKQVAVAGEGTVEIPCQMVLRSIGYKSLALPGLPFDKRRSVVANEKGRVMQGDGAQVSWTRDRGRRVNDV